MAQLIPFDSAPTLGANPWLDSLIYGGAWSASADGVVHLTYSFKSGYDPNQYNNIPQGQLWIAQERAAFRKVFDTWSAVANVKFSETSNSSAADLWYWKGFSADFDKNALAWHDLPDGSGQRPLYGAFNQDGPAWNLNGLASGGEGFLTIMHEIGHGLGLSHPHEQSTPFPGVTKDFDSFGQYNLNQGIFTTMSYNRGWTTKFKTQTSLTYGLQKTPMALDVAAVQLIYGANTHYHTAADTYELPDAGGLGVGWQCIWDAGGRDLISAAKSKLGATIDLREAPLTGAHAGGYVSWHKGVAGGFTIAHGAVIENATGGAGNDIINGNELTNELRGGAGNNTLNGNGGDDRIYGGVGIDQESGGSGNDWLYASKAGDVLDGGLGVDTVDYTHATKNIVIDLQYKGLQAAGEFGRDMFLNIENFIAGSGNDILHGLITDNLLRGGAGKDMLDGGKGADFMYGGIGDDKFEVNNIGDRVIEYGGQGFDTVHASVNVSALASDDATAALIGVNVENVVLSGNVPLFATGNALNNRIEGNATGCTLAGGAGNDKLVGQGGDDVLSGGRGSDVLTDLLGHNHFVFNSAVVAGETDTITSFDPSSDVIELSMSQFRAFAASGQMTAGMLVEGSAALDADDFIIYNVTTKALLYDADADGIGAAVQFAKIGQFHTTNILTEANFLIIA